VLLPAAVGRSDGAADDGDSDAHAQFTAHYDAIAAACPHFERLRNRAKLAQLARWLRARHSSSAARSFANHRV
jgi:hypothetical protein